MTDTFKFDIEFFVNMNCGIHIPTADEFSRIIVLLKKNKIDVKIPELYGFYYEKDNTVVTIREDRAYLNSLGNALKLEAFVIFPSVLVDK